jgi:hypothetical protein
MRSLSDVDSCSEVVAGSKSSRRGPKVTSLSKTTGVKSPFFSQPLLGISPAPLVEMPDQLRPFVSASPEEKKRRALRVLLEARRLYRDRKGTLEACLSDGTLESWWAKEILRGIVWERNLTEWERHPKTKRADVYKAVDRAIRKCRQLRGGWFVSPRKAEAA